MTDQNPDETTTPAGEPPADEPIAGASPDAPGAGASPRGREWIAQLESMIQQISTQAAPVARQVGAKAAELAAVAAVKAGPVAHRAADLTSDYGQRFADRAQSVAAELRSQDAATPDGAGPEAGAAVAAPDVPGAAQEPPPEDTAASGV